MEVEQIITEIKSGLTGDKQKDAEYLMAQGKKYKKHKYAKEIMRECGRLLYDCLPEEGRENIGNVINNELQPFFDRLQEVRTKQAQGDFDGALVVMEALVKDVEELNWYQDDSVSEYHRFGEYFEEALYRLHAKPTKTLRQVEIPLDEIYFQYGSLLVDLKRYDDAETALRTAIRWNPSNVRIQFELSETFKLRGDLETFFKLSIDAFKCAFRPNNLARCYRNIMYYFVEKEQWLEARACCMLSLQFEKSEAALSELQYVAVKAGEEVMNTPIATEFIQDMCKKYGFPFGPHDDVIGLAIHHGRHFYDQGQKEGARYCLQIAYDLIGDDDIKKLLDELGA